MALQMANNLEGGKTPQLSPMELQQLGFKLVAYPLSLLGVSLQAMRTALVTIADGRGLPESMMPPFEVSPAGAAHFGKPLGWRSTGCSPSCCLAQDIQETVGFPEYFAIADRYLER